MTTPTELQLALVEAGYRPGPTYFGTTVARVRQRRLATVEDVASATSLILGVEAVLSHAGAAAYWGLDPFTGQPPLPECSVPKGRVIGNPLVHQRRRIADLDVITAGPIAVTSVLQTLADLGAVYGADVVERAVESAIRLEYVSEAFLRATIDEFHPTWFRTGMASLRVVLARRPVGAKPTGSDAETVCLQHYRANPDIPEPERQFPILRADGTLVGFGDFGFPPVPFFTEIDGLTAHSSEPALAYDLSRQNRALDAEHLFRRFTALMVYRNPMYVCRETLSGLRLARLTYGPRLGAHRALTSSDRQR